jgi:hypothetical protein
VGPAGGDRQLLADGARLERILDVPRREPVRI